MAVYFIRSSDSSIKIGFSKNPVVRLSNLQAQHAPSILELIGFVPGGYELETCLQRYFKSEQVFREWFSSELESPVDRILRTGICQAPGRAAFMVFHPSVKAAVNNLEHSEHLNYQPTKGKPRFCHLRDEEVLDLHKSRTRARVLIQYPSTSTVPQESKF